MIAAYWLVLEAWCPQGLDLGTGCVEALILTSTWCRVTSKIPETVRIVTILKSPLKSSQLFLGLFQTSSQNVNIILTL